MKRVFLAVFILVFAVHVLAEENTTIKADISQKEVKVDPGFKPMLDFSVNLAQNGFSNWAAGGSNSYSWQINLDAGLDYETENLLWKNRFVLKYGEAEIEGTGNRKAADVLKAKTRYSQKVWEFVNPYAEAGLETQMASGYEYSETGSVETSKGFDPVYLRQAVGISIIPVKIFEISAGLGLKQTISDSFSTKYIGTEGDTVKNQVGANLSFHLDTPLMDNITLKSDLDFFSDFHSSDTTDITWESTINAKVNSFIHVNFNFVMLYDKDIVYAAQVKDFLSVGITYGFFEAEK